MNLGKTLFIYGAGSLGNETLLLIKAQSWSRLKYRRIHFIDDNIEIKEAPNGVSILTKQVFLNLELSKFDFAISIADPSIRRKIALEMESLGGNPINILSFKSHQLGQSRIGKGNIVFPGCTMSNNISIENYVIINSNTYIGHDCEIESYVTISPGVTICGNVKIQEEVFLGAGATIKQGRRGKKTTLHSNSLVGLGSVVISDVDSGVTVVGNPAKQRKEDNRRLTNE